MPRHPPGTRLQTLAAAAARDGNALSELLRLTTQERLELARLALRGRAVDPMISAEEVLAPGLGHAEADVAAYARAQGWSLVGTAATRPICVSCMVETLKAGGVPLGPLKSNAAGRLLE